MAEDKEKKLKEELEALRQTAKLEGETLGPAQQRLNISKSSFLAFSPDLPFSAIVYLIVL